MSNRSTTWHWKILLLLGFLSFIVGIIAAHGDPSRKFELSIYSGTTVVYWLGIGGALFTSLIVGLQQVDRRLRSGGLLLSGLSVVSIAGLPIIRGYWFYGSGDPTSHLGWIHRFASTSGLPVPASPVELFHPGVHVSSILLSRTTSTDLRWASMLVVLAFFAAFLLFVPLCVRVIAGDGPAVAIGTFSAALLLPVNLVSVHPIVHPISQTILLLPFLFYLVFNYVTSRKREGILGSPSAIGTLLALTSVGFVLIHSQQALNVVLMFGVLSVGQFLVRRYRPLHTIAKHRALYGQTVFVAAAFGLWAPRFDRFARSFINVPTGLVLGTEPPADEIAQRAGSLAAVGGSIEELFMKMFFISLLFSIIAGIFVLVVALGRVDADITERPSMVLYVSVGLVPVFGLLLMFFGASATTQHFRYLGAIMVGVTIVGAVAITHLLVDLNRRRFSSETLQAIVVVFFVLILPFSLVTVHQSPYIYQDSSQITESRMEGYSTSFEIRDQSIPYAKVRGGPIRYAHYHYGPKTSPTYDFMGREVDGTPFTDGNLPAHYDGERRYVAFSNRDRMREVELWNGLRYSERGFDAMDSSKKIDRVQSNGDFELYLVNGDE